MPSLMPLYYCSHRGAVQKIFPIFRLCDSYWALLFHSYFLYYNWRFFQNEPVLHLFASASSLSLCQPMLMDALLPGIDPAIHPINYPNSSEAVSVCIYLSSLRPYLHNCIQSSKVDVVSRHFDGLEWCTCILLI